MGRHKAYSKTDHKALIDKRKTDYTEKHREVILAAMLSCAGCLTYREAIDEVRAARHSVTDLAEYCLETVRYDIAYAEILDKAFNH